MDRKCVNAGYDSILTRDEVLLCWKYVEDEYSEGLQLPWQRSLYVTAKALYDENERLKEEHNNLGVSASLDAEKCIRLESENTRLREENGGNKKCIIRMVSTEEAARDETIEEIAKELEGPKYMLPGTALSIRAMKAKEAK